jgi:hypothetical protein
MSMSNEARDGSSLYAQGAPVGPDVVLTAEEKRRIVADETYRYEVRGELEDARKKEMTLGGRIFKFLNSAFGVVLFSSIVASTFAWSLGRWDKTQESAKAERASAKRIEGEIRFRVRRVLLSASGTPANTAYLVATFVQPQVVASGNTLFSLDVGSPEFTQKSTDSLLGELSDFDACPGEVLSKARAALAELQTESATVATGGFGQPSPTITRDQQLKWIDLVSSSFGRWAK